MKRLKKRITFIIVPDCTQVARELKIPIAAFYAVGIVIVLSLLSTFYMAAEFFTNRVADKELQTLKAENKSLADKYDQFKSEITTLDSRLVDLVNKEIAIRGIFKLPEINQGERQLGVGGPGPTNYNALSLGEKAAYGTETEVDRLLRLSDFELQKFNEIERSLTDLKGQLDHTPSIWPTDGWQSRGFGMQYDPFTGYEQMHNGLDIANKTGTTVISPANGRVAYVGPFAGMGMMIEIDHGFGLKTRYGHLSKALVRVGQSVERGDKIALMGSTGYSTGPHLHYEVYKNGRAQNPRSYILNEM